MENCKYYSLLHWTSRVLTAVRHFLQWPVSQPSLCFLRNLVIFLLPKRHSCCQPALFPGWERETLREDCWGRRGDFPQHCMEHQLPLPPASQTKIHSRLQSFSNTFGWGKTTIGHWEKSVRPFKNLERYPTCNADLEKALSHTFWSPYLRILNC